MLKRLLILGLLLGSFGVVRAASTDTAEGSIESAGKDLAALLAMLQPPTPIEQAVVELRITRPEFHASADAKYKKHRKEDMMGQGVCSGSFIDDQGDIITAGHCAADATSIDVITYDQRRYAAIVVATSSIHDLALLHIDRLNTTALRPAAQVTRGEQIFILGSPLAITDTLSTGIVAKIAGDTILVDCSALPGNSGSPVFNSRNELVGVLTAGYIVGLGTTHLNIIQSIDAVWYFVSRAFHGVRQ